MREVYSTGRFARKAAIDANPDFHLQQRLDRARWLAVEANAELCFGHYRIAERLANLAEELRAEVAR